MRLSSAIVILASAIAFATASHPVPRLEHVVVIVFENRERSQVLNNNLAPHFRAYSADYATLADYTAVAHPSLPNYLALVSGSTHGITTDCTACAVHGPSIGTLLDRAGLSWGAYAQGYPDSRLFAKKHEPFLYFSGQRGHVHPLSAFDPKRLPAYALITPDLCADAHDCPLSAADRFLARIVPPLLEVPHTAVFVTFDEGTTNAAGGGRVDAFVLGSAVSRHTVSRAPTSHYGLLRTIEDALRLPHLGASAKAKPITGIWKT